MQNYSSCVINVLRDIILHILPVNQHLRLYQKCYASQVYSGANK